jgi:hypothetical protein
MCNPIDVVLKERKMSAGELAVLSGTDGGWIRQLRRMPLSVLVTTESGSLANTPSGEKNLLSHCAASTGRRHNKKPRPHAALYNMSLTR